MKAHDRVLLAESGELPEAERAALAQRLDADSELRSFREATRTLTRVAAEHLPDDGPAPRVLAAIVAEARTRTHGRVIHFPARWSRIAAAAAAVLAAGLWLTYLTAPDARSESARLANAMALVEAVGGASGENGEAVGAGAIEVLASRLLRLQGFTVDDDYDELEVMLPAGSQPTAFRAHNTGVVPAGING